MTTNSELTLNCFLVEAISRTMTLQGKNMVELVDIIDDQFHPTNEFEMEMYSEAIIYGRLSVLN